jgi:hypothetical protein
MFLEDTSPRFGGMPEVMLETFKMEKYVRHAELKVTMVYPRKSSFILHESVAIAFGLR